MEEDCDDDLKDDNKEELIVEDKVIYANQSLSIVIQHSLRATSEESDEDWLRKNVPY